jgi:hypothetical protein
VVSIVVQLGFECELRFVVPLRHALLFDGQLEMKGLSRQQVAPPKILCRTHIHFCLSECSQKLHKRRSV